MFYKNIIPGIYSQSLSDTCIGAGEHGALPLTHGGQTEGKQHRILFTGNQERGKMLLQFEHRNGWKKTCHVLAALPLWT